MDTREEVTFQKLVKEAHVPPERTIQGFIKAYWPYLILVFILVTGITVALLVTRSNRDLTPTLEEKYKGVSWAAYFGEKAQREVFDKFSLVLFNAVNHPYLKRLGDRGKTIVGRLDITDIHKDSPFVEEVRALGLVKSEDAEGDVLAVDYKDPKWVNVLLELIIPRVNLEGFNGILVSTSDSLKSSEDKLYVGKIIRAIRLHFPYLKLLVHENQADLKDIVTHVDGIVSEGLIGSYNEAQRKYVKVPEEITLKRIADLRETRRINPKLSIYTLEYWDVEDHIFTSQIYSKLRANDFVPYVTSYDTKITVHEEELLS